MEEFIFICNTCFDSVLHYMTLGRLLIGVRSRLIFAKYILMQGMKQTVPVEYCTE